MMRRLEALARRWPAVLAAAGLLAALGLGWLTRAGAVAICAPNHITLQLNGRNADYDSLNY